MFINNVFKILFKFKDDLEKIGVILIIVGGSLLFIILICIVIMYFVFCKKLLG